jgi:outer membrane lipoprotein-sorting protein
MQRFSYYVFLLIFLWQIFCPAFADQQATAIIKAAIDYWRDKSSYSVADMTIHRADWQRTMTMQMWTQGMKDSLVRVIKPKKDKGNATLTKNDKMWSFSPKTNRVIKIPSSMMNQSWMGSDFSNNDVAKADNLLKHYTHTLKGIKTHQGQKLFIIEAVPFEDAPVVWGREVLKIRADYIVLEHAFYDQDNILVKKMVTRDIKFMGGKLIAAAQRMQKAEKPLEWTEIVVKEAQFKINVPRRTFTLSNLRNPR